MSCIFCQAKQFILSLLFVLATNSAKASADKPYLGAYIWGGVLESGDGVGQFRNSIKFALDQGFEAVRFAVTPESLKQYHLDALPCAGGRNLTCFLQQMLATPVFDDPRLRYVMITMDDFAGGGHAQTDINVLDARKAG